MLNADSFGGFTGELLSHNVYAYVQNNPVMLYDPSGHIPVALVAAPWIAANSVHVINGVLIIAATYGTLVMDPSENIQLASDKQEVNLHSEKESGLKKKEPWGNNPKNNTFKLPKTVKSNKGVEGNFSIKGYSYRIDTNKTAPGEGGFHIHIYRNGKEIAKVSGIGTWAKTHRGKTLLKPSEINNTIRTEINRLVRHVQKRL
jgi:hypothetical protein